MLDVKIRVKGMIGREWSDWLGGLTITHTEQGDTVLSGSIPDHAALYGVLGTLSDLNLQLVSLSASCVLSGAREHLPKEVRISAAKKAKARSV